ncbi:hypothetical protein MNB_SM-4-1780 [hydrothermal vent metagenome]|uniref:Uncharacterized protein n=1 Tax=hydrothermal vent metagenome TaxID=652676 RepID=A0A1W1C9L3_9ZZZZ
MNGFQLSNYGLHQFVVADLSTGVSRINDTEFLDHQGYSANVGYTQTAGSLMVNVDEQDVCIYSVVPVGNVTKVNVQTGEKVYTLT